MYLLGLFSRESLDISTPVRERDEERVVLVVFENPDCRREIREIAQTKRSSSRGSMTFERPRLESARARRRKRKPAAIVRRRRHSLKIGSRATIVTKAAATEATKTLPDCARITRFPDICLSAVNLTGVPDAHRVGHFIPREMQGFSNALSPSDRTRPNQHPALDETAPASHSSRRIQEGIGMWPRCWASASQRWRARAVP
jgi:hypothetical protein